MTGPHTFAARSSSPFKTALPRFPQSGMTQQKRQFLNFFSCPGAPCPLQGLALAASSAAFKTYSIVGFRLLLCKPCSRCLSAPAQSKKLAHSPPLPRNQCFCPRGEARRTCRQIMKTIAKTGVLAPFTWRQSLEQQPSTSLCRIRDSCHKVGCEPLQQARWSAKSHGCDFSPARCQLRRRVASIT